LSKQGEDSEVESCVYLSSSKKLKKKSNTMASTASPGPHLGQPTSSSGGQSTSNGGMEELLPLVMQLMNADQVSVPLAPIEKIG
jgi:hypothetical protein